MRIPGLSLLLFRGDCGGGHPRVTATSLQNPIHSVAARCRCVSQVHPHDDILVH